MKFRGTECNIEVGDYSRELVIDMTYPTEVGTPDEIVDFYGTTELIDSMDIKDILGSISTGDILDHYKLGDLLDGMEDDIMDLLIKTMGESWIIGNLSESSITQIQREYNIDNILNNDL